ARARPGLPRHPWGFQASILLRNHGGVASGREPDCERAAAGDAFAGLPPAGFFSAAIHSRSRRISSAVQGNPMRLCATRREADQVIAPPAARLTRATIPNAAHAGSQIE